MKGFSKIEILKNVGSSWFALRINVLVDIFSGVSRTTMADAEALELAEAYQQEV